VAVPAIALEIRVLGDLEVLVDGHAVQFRGSKQRALLAALLLERGRAVSVDRLVEALWSGSPPETAQNSIQVYVSGLRKALGGERIVTRGRTYAIDVAPGELDLDRFDALASEAAGLPPDLAAARLREALALVRGRPFADAELELWADREARRVEERVLDATEARITADIALGGHSSVLSELEALVDLHASRERLLELHMLALYRAGRQADALDAYRRGAARLRDELGLEPGRELQRLQLSILRQDESLEVASLPPSQQALRRRRGKRLAAIGALALIAASVGAAAIALTRGGSATLESLPAGAAVISARDGALVAQFSTAELGGQPGEVIPADGHFWISTYGPTTMLELDRQTGRIVRRVDSPYGEDTGGGILPIGSDVWFTGPRLARVDATQGRLTDEYPIARGSPALLGGIARCDGSLWVADNRGDRVVRLDPATGRVVAMIRVKFPWMIACGNGGLWVTSSGVGVQRIDPARNAIIATARLPEPNVTLAVGGGYAWTSNETTGTVYKVDGHGAVIATYETGDGARQVSFAAGRLWVANQDVGTVTGIDAATGDARTFSFGHPVQSVGALGPNLLVELNAGLTYEDRINALRGKVARLIVPPYVSDPPDTAVAWNPVMFMIEQASCSGLVAQRAVAGGLPGAVVADLAAALPTVSADRRTYTFTVRSGARFSPPSNARVTVRDVRAAIERALSPKLGASTPGIRFLSDVVGAQEFHRGAASHVRGLRARGDTIEIALTRPSATFLQRLALPFFCAVPASTPALSGGLARIAAPSAGPYYMADSFNGEYTILKANPNYRGPRPPRLDAIALREGISAEHAVARVGSGAWDGAILYDDLLAPGGAADRKARSSGGRLRTEDIPVRSLAFPAVPGAIHALLSSRLGCDSVAGVLDLGLLCVRGA
jgi:DNA-binding SARP family transcriptional activator